MIKNLIQLYYLIVCYVCAMVLLVSFSVSLNSVTDLTLTKYKYRPDLAKYSSVEKFISSKNRKHEKEEREALELMEKDAIKERIKSEKESYIKDIKYRAISKIIHTLSWILVSMIFWITHFLMYKRNTKQNSVLLE